MSHISIGSAVGAGFGLIGRKPLTVLTWGLLRILFGIGVLAVFAPAMVGMIGPMVQAAQNAQASGEGASQAMSQVWISQMAGIQGLSFLAQIAGLFIAAILYCAVARSIVHPGRGAMAYLRVSAAEFYVAVISFAAGFAIGLAMLICAIPFIIAIAIMAMNKMTVAAVIVGVLGVLILFLVMIYVLLRFAFVIPMMVDDGKFHLFDAWSLTKGHAGALFAIALCLLLIAFVGEIIVGAIIVALGAAAVGVSAGGFENLQAFFQLPPLTILTRLGPWLAVLAVLSIPLQGCAMAIFFAPWARAYRDVVQDVASVFEGSPPPSAQMPPPVPPPAPMPPTEPFPTPA